MLTRATPIADLDQWEGTVRVYAGLAAVVVMAGLSVSTASARVVRMETAVSLTDRSDPAVKQALMEAFDTSMRGAVAMGLPHIRVDGIQVLQDAVVLAMIATDEDDDNEAPDNTRDQ
jgi:hypothetical protein